MVIRTHRFRGLLAAALGFGVMACNEDPGPEGPGAEEETDGAIEDPAPAALSPAEVLTRASLDLRGVRPTVGELQQLGRDPDQLEALIDGFLEHPGFGDRIKQMFAPAWRTRIDDYVNPQGEDFPFPSEVNAAIGDEPLNLIAYVAINDLPYSEVVLGADTFVDPALFDVWPLAEVDGDGGVPPQGTVRARYVDGRPLAGVLSMNAVYWRHASTLDNANRGRANALSQALLCQSYLDRPIDFPTDLDLTDSESIRQAIKSNGACQACHSTLDPFASYLWGFMYPETPLAEYSLGGERAWQLYTDVSPGFFGVPGERLEDLGQEVASDERFVSCAVRRVYEGLLGRPVALDDEGALAQHREAFLDSDLSLKALVRSVVSDPAYRGQPWSPRFGGSPEPVTRKVAPVDVLAASLTDLSGYALTFEGRPATSLEYALRTLAGGSDRGDATNVSTGAVLVQRRLAEAGAMNVVDRAFEGAEPVGRLAGLLAGVDLDATPDPNTIASIVQVTRSIEAGPDDPDVQALISLWTEVAAVSDPRQAWTAVLTATLADPDHLLY